MTVGETPLPDWIAYEDAGLRLAMEPLTGHWSGMRDARIGAQDVVVLTPI